MKHTPHITADTTLLRYCIPCDSEAFQEMQGTDWGSPDSLEKTVAQAGLKPETSLLPSRGSIHQGTCTVAPLVKLSQRNTKGSNS